MLSYNPDVCPTTKKQFILNISFAHDKVKWLTSNLVAINNMILTKFATSVSIHCLVLLAFLTSFNWYIIKKWHSHSGMKYHNILFIIFINSMMNFVAHCSNIHFFMKPNGVRIIIESLLLNYQLQLIKPCTNHYNIYLNQWLHILNKLQNSIF